ncbi:hypothetical protein GCM10025868_13800 [Angustibacter aerolatus]|uniref:Glycosyltransferase 2-like domain-containing protein n=1 Tax=Angustibacter aerolatus TaxID=1162965 RepID=A0ABQ6JD71_9ACTN|nr:hypothetical protein GCM10025868_13800 [Angustibacter aerolatus]
MTLVLPERDLATGTRTTTLDVVVPVYDEEVALPVCVRRLHAHLRDTVPYGFRITVADNASTDGTLDVAYRLAAEPARGAGGAPRREGPRPGARRRLERVGRRGAGLHRRRPVDRPRRAAAAGGAAGVGALRRRHRHPAGPQARAWCAARSAR